MDKIHQQIGHSRESGNPEKTLDSWSSQEWPKKVSFHTVMD
jgi:hypothetical protein